MTSSTPGFDKLKAGKYVGTARAGRSPALWQEQFGGGYIAVTRRSPALWQEQFGGGYIAVTRRSLAPAAGKLR